MNQHQSPTQITTDSVTAENSLLGWMLSGNSPLEEILTIVERLHETDYWSERNRRIYRAIHLSIDERIDPNVSGTIFYLKQADPDGIVKVSELANLVAESDIFTLGQAKKAKETIKRLALQRRITQWHKSRYETSMGYIDDLTKFIAEDENKLLELEIQSEGEKPTSVQDVAREAYDEAKYNFENGVLGTKTGFSLDSILGGFLPGHTWILGAFTGTGKTFLALNMALSVLRQKKAVGFFSLEMSSVEIYYRLAGIQTGKTVRALSSGRYLSELTEAQQELSEKVLNIYDEAYSFDEIRLQCKKQKLLTGLDVFFIDFLQNIKGEGTIYERVSNAIVNIQKLAKEVNATAVVLSQVSNENAQGDQKVLAYKGAGEIAQVADVGLWLEKDKDYEDQLNLTIKKSRHSVSNKLCRLRIDHTNGGKITELLQKGA